MIFKEILDCIDNIQFQLDPACFRVETKEKIKANI